MLEIPILLFIEEHIVLKLIIINVCLKDGRILCYYEKYYMINKIKIDIINVSM